MTQTIKVNDLYMKLVRQTMSDGIITKEENEMLKKALQGLKNFKTLLDQALEDGKISSEEKNSLSDMKEVLVKDVKGVADEDGVITDDEQSLLEVFTNLMNTTLNRSIEVKKVYNAYVKL